MFQKLIVVITGASSGIGKQLAVDLSAAGAVVVLMARSEGKLKQVSMTLQGEHYSVAMDVTSLDSVSGAFQQVIKKYGRIDVLINNAGYGVFREFSLASIEEIEAMMDVNYMGIIRCTKAVLPQMLARGSGYIVNIGSLSGKIGSPKASAYSASKHAVVGFTNSLNMELSGTGIYISMVNPGPVDTPFFEIADPTGGYISRIKWMMIKPEDVSRAVMKAIRRKKTQINIPVFASIAAKLYVLFPNALNAIANKILNKK